jgi:hypothetical protein
MNMKFEIELFRSPKRSITEIRNIKNLHMIFESIF